jgi:hypothetical protein
MKLQVTIQKMKVIETSGVSFKNSQVAVIQIRMTGRQRRLNGVISLER